MSEAQAPASAPRMRLYSYWRSSSAYRVRIALNLKGLDYELIPVHLVRDGGAQHDDAFRRLNPHGQVPLLVHGDFVLGQSLAIMGYLESRFPQPPLGPEDACDAARMRAFCQAIACDIQPLQNLRVLQYLDTELGVSETARSNWARHWIQRGLEALEAELRGRPRSRFAFGEAPTYAECCLVPQLYNARRYRCDLERVPRLVAIDAACAGVPAFTRAHPDAQPDAVTV